MTGGMGGPGGRIDKKRERERTSNTKICGKILCPYKVEAKNNFLYFLYELSMYNEGNINLDLD